MTMPLKASETLVFVHVPKTAGTSLRVAFEQLFGERLQADYDDRPLQHAPWARRAHALAGAWLRAGRNLPARCVYGHFLPLKYRYVRGARFVTWLRDPVQRVVSRYQHYRRAVAAGETAHARWGLVPGLSIEQFIALPQYRDTCAEYFWGFPLSRVEFVGLVERQADDLAHFRRHFDLSALPDPPRINSNPCREGDQYLLEPGLVRRIRALNPRDVRLYEMALERGPLSPFAAARRSTA